MQSSDSFSIWISEVVVGRTENFASADALSDIRSQAEAEGDLDAVLAQAGTFDRRSGDFGAEFIGAMLIPVLIEAGRQLWASYVKRLAEKAGASLADLTFDSAKSLVARHWSEPNGGAAEYETVLRRVAKERGMPAEQIDELAVAVRDARPAASAA